MRKDLTIRVYQEDEIREALRSISVATKWLQIAHEHAKHLEKPEHLEIEPRLEECHRYISKHLQIITYLLTDNPHIKEIGEIQWD